MTRRIAAVRSPRAFSLLELMLVIVIVGILASIAVPSISEGVRRGRAAEQLQDVPNMLLEARAKAHGTLRCAITTVDTATSTLAYELYDCATTPTGVPTKSKTYSGMTLTTFTSGTSITFQPAGSLTVTSVQQITATNSFGERRKMRIYPAIGQIEVFK